PHHGSATSSSADFIDKLQPNLVVIGVGRANPYGHPVEVVRERYAKAGSLVLRTDLDGQIDVVTTGASLQVRRFRY
ncbi:MAG: ComEC/Rec2 family competence protein, partial [Acidimicrobiia bacterium]